ncbi:MAG: carbamate kinase [Betaproteobacteria bacterium]
MSQRLVVAIGGNATHPENIRGTTEEQEEVAARGARALRPLVERGGELVITHGNGPVVGKILLRQYYAREHIAPMRLDVCVAHSQGGIGHLLMQGLEDELARAEVERQVCCLVTRVEVSEDDPAFHNPTKPIGPFFSAEEADNLHRKLGWNMIEDAGRGWRYVVPSPRPKAILELGLIASLAAQGVVVIAAGGGGIPMVHRPDGSYSGVPAVVDKDLSSALLATALGFDALLLLTAVSKVAIHFGTPDVRSLDTVTASELHAYAKEGHFAAGSMAPKVEAALKFIAHGGRRAVIAHLDEALAALDGKAGTQVVPG